MNNERKRKSISLILIIFIIFCYNASHLVTDNPVFIA